LRLALIRKRGNSGKREKETVKKLIRLVPLGLLVFGLIGKVNSAFAAAGSLDPTFGKDGITI
jgi:hypothetical protein